MLTTATALKKASYRLSWCLTCRAGTPHEVSGRPGRGKVMCLRCGRRRER